MTDLIPGITNDVVMTHILPLLSVNERVRLTLINRVWYRHVPSTITSINIDRIVRHTYKSWYGTLLYNQTSFAAQCRWLRTLNVFGSKHRRIDIDLSCWPMLVDLNLLVSRQNGLATLQHLQSLAMYCTWVDVVDLMSMSQLQTLKLLSMTGYIGNAQLIPCLTQLRSLTVSDCKDIRESTLKSMTHLTTLKFEHVG